MLSTQELLRRYLNSEQRYERAELAHELEARGEPLPLIPDPQDSLFDWKRER